MPTIRPGGTRTRIQLRKKMRLSDTKNPKNGQPFTREQITAGATKYGVSWKKTFGDDPELSDALVSAVGELGWENPGATLARAAKIQSANTEAARVAERAAAGRVVWHGESVWIDGVRDGSLFANAAVHSLRAAGVAISGDAFAGRAVGEVADEVIETIRSASAARVQIAESIITAPKTIQEWDENGNPQYS